MLLWKEVANESATRCCTSATRDFKTVSSRIEHEGLSFLTITLPNFGADFHKSLSQGSVDPDLFSGFQKRGGLPLFLGGFLDRVFDRSSGLLFNEPCVDAILAIRQLTLMFSKISLPCSDARIRKAMRGYVECEMDVRSADRSRSDIDLFTFGSMSALLFARAFSEVDLAVYQGEVVPQHGPGATADSLRGNGKFHLSTWTSRLEEILPSGEFLLPNWRFYDQFEAVDIHEPGSEIPVKVITVPKTLKTPRIIGIEPAAMQYAQQSLLPEFIAAFSRDDFLKHALGFEDQTPNQRMALQGSFKGDLATLDLSEASDRVSNQLVRHMLRQHPYIAWAVDASRSRKADVDGYGVLRLAKFASMGSALTFPIEASVFLTLVMIGIERELSEPLTRKTLHEFVGKVRIYGDDIIVPVEYVRSVIHVLETFGFQVNRAKSFWNGKFRESCGKEYYDGHDVSIVKVRKVFPTSPKHAGEVISLVAFRNQLYTAGYWTTCKWLDEEIRKILKYFPVVLPTSPVLGRHSFLGHEVQAVDEDLQSPIVKGWVVSSRSPSDPLDEHGALLKYFLRSARMSRASELSFSGADTYVPSEDGHLERAGRPRAVNIKPRWASPM